QSIADQLRAGEIPQRETTRDVEAYRLYKEGSFFFNQFQPPESNMKAIERYQQAIQHDATFALAYAGIAEAYAYQAENFVIAPRWNSIHCPFRSIGTSPANSSPPSDMTRLFSI